MYNPKYNLALQALILLGASGHIVADAKDKRPMFPRSAGWIEPEHQCDAETAVDAWEKWGDLARGVGAIMGTTLLTFDFDPFERAATYDEELNAKRKLWRAATGNALLRLTFGERSRSGRGAHFFVRVTKSFADRRGVRILKKLYAIDVLSGPSRYCDVTGDRLNDLPPFDDDGDGFVEYVLAGIEKQHPEECHTSEGENVPGTYPIACLAELLTYIRLDPEYYKGWVDVGMALCTETNGSNAGLRLWDEWSRATGGAKYTGIDALARKWQGFKCPGKLGVGSIVYMAQQGGANIAQIRLKHSPVANVVIPDGWATKRGGATS
ncbi:PriCT-2 domain-containing protein [Mesorhizobium sp. M0037]|uniref:PriCT-2 domain-containing protein n=1 Tax=unclassified Mesorhizobium TaxID=325217 RepID=UPI003337A356